MVRGLVRSTGVSIYIYMQTDGGRQRKINNATTTNEFIPISEKYPKENRLQKIFITTRLITEYQFHKVFLLLIL